MAFDFLKIVNVNIINKMCYCIIFGISCGIFIDRAIQCFAKYLKGETRINVEVKSSELAEFPAFTICPDYDVAYKVSVLEKYNTKPNDMREFNYPKSINKSFVHFFEEVTNSKSDLIKNIEIETKRKLSGTNFSEFIYMFGNQNHDNVVLPIYMKTILQLENFLDTKNYSTIFGRCYTFKVPHEVSLLQVLDITFKMKMNSVVFAHHHGQFYNTDTNSKLSVKIGKKLFIEMIHDITYSLPKYLPPENIYGKGYNVTCTDDRSFWTDYCTINELDRLLLEEFNCVCPIQTKMKDKQFCEIQHFTSEQKIKFKTSYHESMTKDLFCPLPCSTMGIYFGFPVIASGSEKEAFVKLYFKNQINVQRSRLAYDSLSLFAEISAYFGILLGFSALDINNIVKRFVFYLSQRGYNPT